MKNAPGLVCACALTLLATPPIMVAAATRSLTIEQISGAPFPSQLSAAPEGSRIAWIYNERGARNVWIGEKAGKAFHARRLTTYTADDGNDINDLVWNGDSHSLFYTRGGDANGVLAVNPMSLAAGPKAGELWSVSIEGGAPKLLGAGNHPTPSPRGDMLVFLRDHQPFLLSLAGSGEAAALFKDSSWVSELTWAPQGDRFAFVSNRPQHSLVGIFDLAKKTVTWVASGIDEDDEPVWSPDGKRLAFRRMAHDEAPSYVVSHREGPPWQIWIADAATGTGHPVWTAKPGPGSHCRELFNSQHSLFWTADERLVFPWEVTGWVRLYSVSIDTPGAATVLTPGDAEIFGAEISKDRGHLFYTSNLGDIDRRHIWSVSLKQGSPQQLTNGKGVEDYPVVTSDSAVYALRGEARVPLRPVEVSSGRVTDVVPEEIPADFPTNDLVEPQLVTFPAADGVLVHGQLFIPRGRTAKGPALLFFHGGPTNRQTFAAWDPFETHTHLYEANQYLANRGYVVLSVNYRGGAGYGLDFREAKDFGAGGASELNDIIGAAKYMIARNDVDPKKLGAWGGSYGGRMTSLALAAAPEYFAAGADYAGVHDWTKMPGFPVSNDALKGLAYKSSAIGHVDTWKAPVLLLHGDADWIVPFAQTLELAGALRARGVSVDYFLIPDEVHFLLKHSSWSAIFEATREFMDRQLKP